MRWQYWPPVSRTAICGLGTWLVICGERLRRRPTRGGDLAVRFLLYSLNDHLLGGILQRFRLGHGVDSLQNNWVEFHSQLTRIFHAKRRDVHFASQLLFGPFMILGVFGF